MKASSIVKFGFLVLVLCYRRAAAFAIKTHLEANAANQNSNNDTLVFAHVIYRHGDRTMTHGMQLTLEGKRQLYRSGEFFRRRYNQILGPEYSAEKVYVISTDTDRAIMSAQANLAALFVPTESEKIKEDLLWQPVSVHTVPDEMDTLIHGGKPCPKYEILYEYYMEKSPESLDTFAKYKDLIAFWSEQSGRELENIEDVTNYYKRLMTDKGQNKTLPDWAEEAIKPGNPMEKIANVTYKLRGTPELVRLRSGFLIKDILERTAKKIQGTLRPANLTMYMYSAHSSTLATMLNGFGLNELNLPPYASSLHFDLKYSAATNKYYLQFYYRKPDVEYPQPMNIPGCGEKWTLDQFYIVYEKIIPGDFDAECKVDEDETRLIPSQ